MTITITPVTTDDLPQLQATGRQTFYETFYSDNTPEDMQLYLDTHFSTHRLTTELSNPYSAFYFAWYQQQVVGYLKINEGPAQTDINDKHALEIERIYVRKDFYGKKVGQQLFEKALQIAREKSFHYVWLGVWEHNTRALRFYQKNGFHSFGTHRFFVGHDNQTDVLMKRNLK